jgi:hypothetical protein
MNSVENNNECPICFDVIGDNNNIITECGHKFHASCIMRNVSMNGFGCPCCRSVMADEPESDDDDSTEYEDDDEDETTVNSANLEPDNDYVMRGFRLFTSRFEEEEPDYEDVYTEERSEYYLGYISTFPTYNEVIHCLREDAVSYEQLVAYILHCKEGYEHNQQIRRIYRYVFDKIDKIINLLNDSDEGEDDDESVNVDEIADENVDENVDEENVHENADEEIADEENVEENADDENADEENADEENADERESIEGIVTVNETVEEDEEQRLERRKQEILNEWNNYWFSNIETIDFSEENEDDDNDELLWEMALFELEKNMNSRLSVF